MPHFAYKGRDREGAVVTGRLEAVSADAVASELQNAGIVPVEIQETAAPAEGNPLWARLRERKPGLVDRIQFARQLHTLLKAGVPIIRALQGLADNLDNPAFARVLREVVRDLESGHDLAAALSHHPEIFDDLFVSLVRVGEQTGRLDESLLRLSFYLEREKDTRDRIKAAMRYPLFVISAIVVALVIINLFVIPTFAAIFEKFHAELPWQTRLLLTVSNFMIEWKWWLLGGAVLTVLALRQYVKTPRGRLLWDRFKLRLPIVGRILHETLLARFANAFAMTLRSGVPLLQGITVVSRAVDNTWVERHILQMRGGIELGESLTRTAAQTGMFTPLVLQMIAVGEETGAVDEMLENVSEFYDREVDYQLKNLSSAIEPILIIIIGAMVLILALGVFLPMWDLAQVVKGPR